MTVDTLTDLAGKQIKGYELRELLGKGGFGAVYRAFQPAVRREVAVKVILPEYVNNPEFIRRFEAEAQIVAHLEHMNVVPLYDFWRDADGAFIVMRYFRGGSLRSFLKKERWPLDDVGRLVDQIAAGLAAAHHQGIVHRDLKPDNILLDDDQNAYLADFGIARDLQNRSQLETLYKSEEEQGRMMGSPYYLSPEQIRVDPVSPRSDIYSFGIMLYEIFTGIMPYEGLPLSTLITKHLNDPLPPLQDTHPDLPDSFTRIIERATAKNPEHRYAEVRELTSDLHQALAELGISHQVETLDLIPDMRDGVLMPRGGSELEPINPYKGLRAFQEADANDFFGREALVERLLERFDANAKAQFLSVVGPSGSGKSSVVKAGLLPRLRAGAVPGSRDWFIVEMVPGSHPLEELEAALLRVAINPPASLLPQLKEGERGLARAIKRVLPSTPSAQLLLVIDQFEEVFTQLEDETERAHLLALLRNAASDPESRFRLITTLRADFYDRPLLYPEFGELVRAHTEVVLPLSRDELHQAIVEPAANAGLGLEANLVPEIINDVAEQPGALPLLQYALTELFERRDERWLTLQAYRDIGGVSGALAQRADELFAELDEKGQITARQLFLRLVTLNEGAEDTRRRVLLDELLSLQGDAAQMQAVVDRFGKYRLLTFDRDPATRTPTIEIAHEALIRRWGRFQGWISESREGMRIQRRLTAAAEDWLNSGKDPSFLASGARLDQFETWEDETDLALTGKEFAYLDASLAERVKQRAEEEARLAEKAALERRSRNFLRALAGVLAVATIGALVLTGFALNQSRIADQNAVTATFAQGDALQQADAAATSAAVAQINAAEARSLAFASGAQLALNGDNTDLAILLALKANENGQSNDQTRRILAEAAYAPGTRRVFSGHEDRVSSLAYSPDGTMAVSSSRDRTLILWDVATGAEIRQLEGHADWVWDAAFILDGSQVISAGQDSALILWDVETGELVRRYEGHTGAVRAVAFGPEAETMLSGSDTGEIFLWDVASGDRIRAFEGNTTPIYDLAFSKSGFTAISGGDDSEVITLWNVESGEAITRYGAEGEGHTGEIWSLSYTPDETGMLSGSDDSTMILWSFESGQPVRRFIGHSTRVTSVAISSDGTMAASGSEDNLIYVWDMATGAPLHRFSGHSYLVYAVAFSPDNRQLLSGSWDTTLRLWDLQNGAQVRQFNGHNSTVNTVAYSPDGKLGLSAGADGIILWDVETGEEVRRLIGQEGLVNAVAFSPDGQFALSGADDFGMILWDVATGEIVRRYGGPGSSNGHSDAVWAVAFSADGTLAASGSRDNTVIIWDVATGEELRRLFGHTFRVTGVAFSPDGSLVASSGFDNLVILWDTATGEEVRRLEGHTDWVRSVTFSPDGETLLSASADNTLILWDTDEGERLRQYEGHTAQVFGAVFSPDGLYAASASSDATIILWDVQQGIELRRFAGHSDDVRAVAFSPDGRYLLSGSGDQTVRLWQIDLTLDDLTAWVNANRYVREFTCAERSLYDIEPLCDAPTPVFDPGSV